MNEQYNRAIDAVQDEMAKAPAGSGVHGVGEIVTDLLPQMPTLQAAVVEKGKSLEGAYQAMREYAQKNQKGGCYYMPPGQAMEMILKYYGVEAGAVVVPSPAAAAAGAGDEDIAPTTDELDALLEGL